MKVIDFLIKKAKGETSDNCKMKIKSLRGIEFEEINEYVIYDRLLENEITLNDEVEIIEEKEIEKITEYDLNQCESLYDVSQFYKDKVNKLINAVNEMKKEK